MNIMRAAALVIASLFTIAADTTSSAEEQNVSRSYEELFMGLPLPFAERAPSPNPGTIPADTVKALYSNEVFFHLRNSFPKPVTDYLSPCLSKDLKEHFDNSRAEIDLWFERHKNEKQQLKLPMSEGAIFVSCYDGATEFRLGTTTVKNDRARVKVHLTYKEGEYSFEWVDIALLVKVDGKWLLEDIQFDPARSPGATLRKRTKIDR